MAVYTSLSFDEISAFMERYRLGRLTKATGIAEGVENTNYLVAFQTDGDEEIPAILTLFEKRVAAEDLPFFVQVMDILSAQGFFSPRPFRTEDGTALQTLKDKTALVVSFLNGTQAQQPGIAHMASLGEAVARMHKALESVTLTRPNPLSLAGWCTLYEKTGTRLDNIAPGLQALVQRELEYLAIHWPQGLPSGIIHADLFPDNVFFEHETISGIIDFYFACHDAWMYELAIIVQAWCLDLQGTPDNAAIRTLLAAYANVRPFTETEREAFPLLLRGAALRFLLTRAYDWLNRVPGALVTPKDPMEYACKLKTAQRLSSLGDFV